MEYIKVLLPSICVGLLFWYVIRTVVRADSIERKEMDKYYEELEAAEGAAEVAVDASVEPAEGGTPAGGSADSTNRRKGSHGGQDGQDPH
ncbi:hypothetical protein [Brevibacterium samyangense]|uniref:Uncharacterized protein n=1 Tax=Brevibacterium samyangense TaxID=366888 RepID=A0ABP5EW19_9MICO